MLGTNRLIMAETRSKVWTFLIYFLLFCGAIYLMPYLNDLFKKWITQQLLVQLTTLFATFLIIIYIMPYIVLYILTNWIKK